MNTDHLILLVFKFRKLKIHKLLNNFLYVKPGEFIVLNAKGSIGQ